MNRERAHWVSMGWALLAFALALLVRLPLLGRTELWGDEILLVRYMADAALSPWQAFLGYWQNCIDFGQLPLGGVVLNAWMHVAGRFVPDVAHHVLALRIPGALAGAFAVVGGFRLGRRLVRPEINLAATAMAAFFFFPVYYSREVYCYPYVLLCAAFAFLHFHQSLFDERRSHAVAVALFLWSAALGLTHFGCSVALAAMDAAAILLWIGHARAGRAAAARRAAETAVACALAGLAAAPYWARILLGDSPHVAMESPYSLFRILNDMVAKFFLGDRLVPNALAWGLFAVGLIALARRREDPVPGRVCVGVTVATALALAILAKKSQYTSVRYFAMLAPLVYLVFAQGLWSVAHAAGRLFRRERAGRVVFRAAVVALVAVHAGLFLPELYRLTEKGGPFATTARWLNENLPPGSPYLFDCGGFDLRYVPGYHATPGLYPAVRIAGNGPGFMDDVRARQRQVLARFPVSAFIRDPASTWDEADGFYRNVVGFQNPPLRKLRERGIFPDVETRHFEADGFDILYNEPADALAMARAAGQPIYVEYPRFRYAEIGDAVCGRVIDGGEAELVVHNLRDAPRRGVFRIAGAISATNADAAVHLTLPSGATFATNLPCAEPWTLATPPDELPPGISRIRWTTSGAAAEKLLVMDVQFVEP